MAESSLKETIEQMTWSFSRVKAFEDCPYRWYLRYIHKLPAKELFFSSYGSFMHRLLELYCSGKRTPAQLKTMYLSGFRENITGRAPNIKVFESYFKSGLNYLESLEPFPFEVISTEEKVDFELDGHKFTGFIDIVGQDDGGKIIADHKSRTLKPRSVRAKPTKSDLELDDYLRQLYIYAAALEQKYGEKPDFLCFNCFRTNTFIKEPFIPEAYDGAKKWLTNSIDVIANTEEFSPNIEYFKCNFLCDMQDHCEYFELMRR